MKLPIRSGKNPTNTSKHTPNPTPNPTPKPPRRVSPSAVAWLLVLTVFAAAVAYATTGTLTINGSTSGSVTVQAPAVAGSTTFQLPGNNGTNTYVLQTDGTGVTSWVAAGAGSSALSGLTAATAGHSFNNVNYAQTWTWGTLGANTALSLTTTDMTTGTLLNLSNTDTAANAGTVLIVSNSEGGNSTGISSSMLSATNTGYAGYFSNATTNAGYAVYGTMTAHNNTGYAGYFINTDTSTTTNYGVYGTAASSSGYGGYFRNTSTGWALSATGTSYFNGSVGIGTATPAAMLNIYSNTYPAATNLFSVTMTGKSTPLFYIDIYGNQFLASGQVETGFDNNLSQEAITTSGYPLYISTDGGSGSNNNIYIMPNGTGGVGIGTTTVQTGAEVTVLNATTSGTTYGGYFSSATTGAGYGVYGTITGHGNTGYAGYFINTDTSATALNYGIYSAISSTSTTQNNTAVYGTAACGSCFGVSGIAPNNVGVNGSGWMAGSFNGSTYGVTGASSSTGLGYGVYGSENGHANTGYAGYFTNTDTSSATNYGIYASVAGSGGTAGYFNGGKLQVTNTTAFNPTTMPIDSVVVGSASANGCAGDGVFMSDTTTVGDGQGFIAYLGGSTYIGQLQSGNCYLGITFSNSGYIGIWNGSPSATFDVGLNGTTTGNIRLEGHTSGYVQLSPSAAAGSWTMTLPTAAGTSGYVLSTDGTGVTSWIPDAGTASTALSGITAGSATNTINSTNKAQVWNWTTLSTQTALTISNGGLTTGTLLALTSTSATAGTGVVLNVSDSQGGNSTGISSTMLSATNTGYAGYFSNATTNAGYAVYGTMTAHNNTGYAGFFQNTSTGGYAGFFTNTATTGGPNAIVSIYSNNYPAGQDKLDVGDVNGTDLSIDQWGNTYFSSAIYYIGYDNNYGITALSTNSVPLYITTDGAAGANDNIYLTPNGTGYTYVSGSTVINNSNLNNDVPLYVDTNAQDASIAINRQNDTADRAMIRLANALPLSTTVINWYVGEQGGDYGFAFNMYNGTNSYTPLYVSSDQYVGIGTNYAWPQAQLDVQGSIATGTISVEDEFHITRTINTGVAYPQLASFQLGSYAVNSSGNGYGPATRLDIDLKAAANSNLTGDTNVMTLLSDVAVGIGTTAPAHTLDVRGMEAANGIISNGTTFTLSSGCGTPTNLTGGATTGSFKAKATTCTAVIVLPTAPNGWWCSGWDVTTTADTLKMTTDSTTSCTLSGTVATNDIIVFHAEGF
jgi:hypothetical protein